MGSKPLNYRKMKMILNKYHKFSFNMPRKGRDFKPSQKSAITRLYNKYIDLIKAVEKDKMTFLKFPKNSKLPGIDGIRSNKGVFYKYPGAEIHKVKNKYVLVMKYKKLREVFLPFPENIVFDVDAIRVWSDLIIPKLDPDYIMWSVNGFRGIQQYDPDVFEFYMEVISKEETYIQDALDTYKKSNTPYFNGLIIGMNPRTKRFFKDIDVYKAITNANNMIREWKF